MRIALYGLHREGGVEPDRLRQYAVAAEEGGFESLWVGDHIALPAVMEGADEKRLEALTALTYLAAVTKNIRLGVGVLVLPQRNPVLLAKHLTSLDVLSNGRLMVGVGVGHIEGEMAALGIDKRERGLRTDEYLKVMKELWINPVATFRGRWISFDGIVQAPAPVQVPHPPIVVGGHSEAAMARAASSANGWYGWMVDEDMTMRARQKLTELSHQLGRSRALGPLEVTIAPRVNPAYDDLRRYEDLGVHRVVMGPDSSERSVMERFIEQTANDLIARL